MESGGDEGLPRLLVFPGSLSSWRALIVAEELQVKVNVETVNMFLWEHLKPEHLALAPQGTIPTLVLPTGRSLIGQVSALDKKMKCTMTWSFTGAPRRPTATILIHITWCLL